MPRSRPILAAGVVAAALSPAYAFDGEHPTPAQVLDQARAFVEAVGLPAKNREGFALFKKLADEGDGAVAVQAQWAVGNFYLNGIGTAASYDKAMVYLAKARAGGMPEAARLIARIEKR
jgi:TPR repeat protein